ncbi:MAG TPA: outer membrane lipoprotein carrier protein LolA [Phycisphaerales bacterium]|jgi:outer membrane lipoprotein-sorting protein|nr:outer membrane lipoprotein carrier protein LolA [Phycisphaerales bacterium]
MRVVLALTSIGGTLAVGSQHLTGGGGAGPSAIAPSDNVVFHRRLAAIDARVAEIVDLRADFEQKRYTPLLQRPLVSNGTVMAAGDRMRWDTTSPSPSSMLVGRTAVELYYPEDHLIEVYPVDRGFMDLAGVPMPRLSILSKRFDISRLNPLDMDPTCDGDRYLAIELVPRAEDLRNYVTAVQMLIDGSRAIATIVVMTGPDGDRTEIVFSNTQLNTGLVEDRLVLDVPEGVRRVQPLSDIKDQSPQRDRR